MSKLKTVGELKTYLEKLSSDMPIGLLDITTDNPYESTYTVQPILCDYEDLEENVQEGKMLCFKFENSLNENSIIQYIS